MAKNPLSYLSLGLIVSAVLPHDQAQGYFMDGNGHYSLRARTLTNSGFNGDFGNEQGIEQNFQMRAEARLNDRSSFITDIRIHDPRNERYLGDQAQPKDCATRRNTSNQDCTDRHQDLNNPGYRDYTPRIERAFMRYAFDNCLLEAGRRERHWGMGIFMNSGRGPFDGPGTSLDGVTCNVNIQKSQTLGFSFGMDKLTETGTFLGNPYDKKKPDGTESEFDSRPRKFGALSQTDDIDQYFFTIDYDDRKTKAGTALSKQIGIYFANAVSRETPRTDVKFLDLYTQLFFSQFTFQNEFLLRMGRSADPSFIRLGGAREDDEGEVASNKVQSAGFAGKFEFILSEAGTAVGPEIYRDGNHIKHSLFLDYAYAPGDRDGYYSENSNYSEDDAKNLGEVRRNSSATAMAFHRNYKPALILFDQPRVVDEIEVDGAFSPSQVVNSTVLGIGYNYQSIANGDFRVKLLNARLNEGMPADVRSHYSSQKRRPVGYSGNNLGYELDMGYTYHYKGELDLGVAGGIALPGDAWKVDSSEKPSNAMVAETFVTFQF